MFNLGVAWISPDYLKDMQIEGNLCDSVEENLIKLLESLVSVELPDDNDDLLNIVGTVVGEFMQKRSL